MRNGSIPLTRAVIAVFIAVGLGGCGDTTRPTTGIAIQDGDRQTGLAGFAVNIPPSVVVTDQLGNLAANVNVTFTVTSGGGSVTGSMEQTDAEGIATVGAWTLGTSPGTNTLDATATGVGTVTFTATAVFGAYNIEVRFLSTVTPAQQQAFLGAAERWEILIFGDIPDTPLNVSAGSCSSNSPPVNETIDDLLIFATIGSIDGPGGLVGRANWCFIRASNKLPVLGWMILDEADVADVESFSLLDELTLHEMGHVIGLGEQIWDLKGLLVGAGGSDPHFTGARAIEAFDRIGGANYTGGEKVPVDNTSGGKFPNSHWRESVFGTELMTAAIDAGVPNPLSEVTTASFWDLGYRVNLDGSDSFTLTTSLALAAPGSRLELIDGIADLPIYVVDAGGRIVDVIRRR